HACASSRTHRAIPVGSQAVPETIVHRKGLSGLSPGLLPTDPPLPFAPLLPRRLYILYRFQSTFSGSEMLVCSGPPPSFARPLCSRRLARLNPVVKTWCERSTTTI